MVRVNLSVFNNSNDYVPLDFTEVGDLTQPLNAEVVNVVKFSIPNGGTPIWVFPTYPLYITLGYNGVFYQQQVTMIPITNDPTDINNVYEISHLLLILNQAIQTAVTQLNLLIPVPSVSAPYFTYDNNNNVYSLVVLTSVYSSLLPVYMSVSVNTPLFNILQSLPVREDILNPNRRFTFLVVPTNENVYLTNYTKLTQEANSLSNYAYPRTIIITTSMPVQGEVFCSKTASSQQTWLNVIQNLTLDYSNGVKNLIENNDFSTVADFYRSSKIVANGIYSVKCGVYYQTSEGDVKPFLLPPYRSAFIMLEFK